MRNIDIEAFISSNVTHRKDSFLKKDLDNNVISL